jgi:predicted DNA binding CopG/RHH family protein
LPEFASQRELVRFLDDPKVDLSAQDLEAFGERADVDVDDAALRLQEEAEYGRAEPLRPVTIRLDSALIRALKRIGGRKGLSYQTLARMWLRERAIQELRSSTVDHGRRKPSAARRRAGAASVG